MKRNLHRMHRASLRCALPLAAVFLFPSVALAATNLPPPDAGQIGETAQPNALKSHLPVTEGGAESATFRLARITVTQDGTQLSADELNRRVAVYAERTISEAELSALLTELTTYARSHGYPAAAAYLPPQTNHLRSTSSRDATVASTSRIAPPSATDRSAASPTRFTRAHPSKGGGSKRHCITSPHSAA